MSSVDAIMERVDAIEGIDGGLRSRIEEVLSSMSNPIGAAGVTLGHLMLENSRLLKHSEPLRLAAAEKKELAPADIAAHFRIQTSEHFTIDDYSRLSEAVDNRTRTSNGTKLLLLASCLGLPMSYSLLFANEYLDSTNIRRIHIKCDDGSLVLSQSSTLVHVSQVLFGALCMDENENDVHITDVLGTKLGTLRLLNDQVEKNCKTVEDFYVQDSQLIPLAKAADYYGVVDVFDLCAERIALKARGQVDVSFLPGNPDEFPSPPELSKRHVSTPDAPKRPTRRRIHGGDGPLQPLQLSF